MLIQFNSILLLYHTVVIYLYLPVLYLLFIDPISYCIYIYLLNTAFNNTVPVYLVCIIE